MSFRSILVSGAIFTFAVGALAQTGENKADDPPKKVERAFAFAFNSDDVGFLGVEAVNVNSQNSSTYGLSSVRGVAVKSVVDDSPAAKAGLISNDVIVSVNGEEVTSVRKLSRLVSEIAPDHQADIKVLRSGSEKDITVTIGKRPGAKFENGNFDFPIPRPMLAPDGKTIERDMTIMVPRGTMGAIPAMPDVPGMPGAKREVLRWRSSSDRSLGVGIIPLTKQLAETYKVAGGMLVTSVNDNSPAARAGMKAGDVLIEINGKPISAGFDMLRELNESTGDVQLTIERKGKRQTLTVTPEKAVDAGTRLDGGMMPSLAPMKMPFPKVIEREIRLPLRTI